MKFKNYIWDFDGTIVDTYPLMSKAFKIALKEKNIDATLEEINTQLKKSSVDAINYYEMDKNFKRIWKEIEQTMDKSLSEPFDGIREILKFIKNKGGKNFVVTHRDKTTYDFLDFFDLEEYFEDVLTIEEAKKRKPEVDMFEKIIKRNNINPLDTLSIGDRSLDLIPSNNLSMSTCLYNPEGKIINCERNYEIKSYYELLEIIN